MSVVTFRRKFLVAAAGRSVFLFCILLLVVGTNVFADGSYQRTKDGKTLVWNQDPKPTDRATWSGDRDRDGYASGFGTLTWYTTSQNSGDSKETVYARYFGNMVLGKFDGPVNGHSKGVTGHAIFSQGKRVSRWAAGPVPSWKVPKSVALPTAPETPKIAETTSPSFNPPPPSYGVAAIGRPVPDFENLGEQSSSTTDVPEEGPAEVDKSTDAPDQPGAMQKPKLEIDESLRSLVGPPPSLQTIPVNRRQRANNQTDANNDSDHLTEEQVIRLADSEARRRGYDLKEYQHSGPRFDPVDNTWSLFYEQKAGTKTAGPRKRFTMAIDEKTRRTAVVPAR